VDPIQRKIALYNAIFYSANYAIIATDMRGIIQTFNRASERMFGYTAEEVIGKKTPEILHDAEDVARRATELTREFEEPVKPGFETFVAFTHHDRRVEEREWVYVRKNGSRFPGLLSVTTMIDEQGKAQGYLGIVSDLTARKAADEAVRTSRQLSDRALQEMQFYKFALDQHASIAITDDQGVITFVNDRFCQISKRTREELIGQTHRIIKSDYHPKSFFAEMWQTILAGRVWHGEVCNRAGDGSLYWVASTIVPFRDEGGTIRRYMAVRTDITEQKKIEEALQQRTQELAAAKELAEAANAAKSAFVANMSHEIRTPMAAILGYADLLADPHHGGADRAEALTAIQRNGRHLLELINDVLDLSKIEAGAMRIEHRRCDIAAVLSEVLSMTRPRALQKGLEITLRFPARFPRMAVTDPLRLRQILVNLVGNAIKFTNKGGIEVRVSSPRVGAESTLCFEVIDTGIGMNAETIGRLFRPFTQADPSTTRRFGGTGLGLTISQRLARLLGGEIVARSMPGQGSTLTLTIAAGSLSDADLVANLSEAAIDTGVEAPAAADPLPGVSVLLVEDGTDNRAIVAAYLRRAGVDVDFAADGREALHAAFSRRHDAVLMDMQMPHMDGYEATRILRRRGFLRPIIALTAHAMSDDRARCLQAGCNDYLSKPVDSQALVQCLRRHIVKPQEGDGILPLVSRFQNDPEMAGLLREFVGRLGEQARVMRQALDQRDLQTLQHDAHQLKGSGGSYGFDGITAEAGELETALRAGADFAQIRQLTETLLATLMRASASGKV